MKRILPEQVLAAFRETKALPTTGNYHTVHYEQNYCCGVGVLLLGKDALRSGFSSWLGLLGLDREYVSSFIDGFDGETLEGIDDGKSVVLVEPSEQNVQGYLDGIASHLLVAEHIEELQVNARGEKS